jgi:nucleoside-diphosphate-sugar epimerase
MRALVTGAGGFIGGHLVQALLADDYDVVAVDSKPEDRWRQPTNEAWNISCPIAEPDAWRVMPDADVVFHLAGYMGNIEYIQNHRLGCAFSTRIDMNMIDYARANKPGRIFFSSSACIYPHSRQEETDSTPLSEDMAWPADPEPGYGLQKLYTEEMLRYLWEDEGIETRVARYHSIYGPHSAWSGGREKAPTALCRKVAEAVLSGADHIDVWGDGQQTRTYLHIDDCVEATVRLVLSNHREPVNIGSDRLVSIDELARIIMDEADVDLAIIHVPGPQGARGRNSDNTVVTKALDWEPTVSLEKGLADTYQWVLEQVRRTK